MTYWPEEAEKQRNQKPDVCKKGQEHDMQKYTGSKRIWHCLMLWKPDLICTRCGKIGFFPD